MKKVIDIFKDSNGFYAEAVRKGNPLQSGTG